MNDLSIIAGSFWAHWDYAKILHKMGDPGAKEQFEAAKKIRDEWNARKKQRTTAGSISEKY